MEYYNADSSLYYVDFKEGYLRFILKSGLKYFFSFFPHLVNRGRVLRVHPTTTFLQQPQLRQFLAKTRTLG